MLTSTRASTRPNWAEVSLSALRHNFRALQRHVGVAVTICAVVKCDAYGHGSEACALALEQESAGWFGVTSTDEGVALRDAGVRSRILILVGAFRGEEEDALRYGLTPTVSRIEDVEAIAQTAARLGLRDPVPVHLKLDTGMARLGLSLSELINFTTRVKMLPQVHVEGVFSHLASAEVLDAADAECQQLRFREALRTLGDHGLRPPLCHLANSSATLGRPGARYNFVRPGMAIYGYELPLLHRDGTSARDYRPLGLIPAMSWKTRVLSLRDVPAGQALGYNGACTDRRHCRRIRRRALSQTLTRWLCAAARAARSHARTHLDGPHHRRCHPHPRRGDRRRSCADRPQRRRADHRGRSRPLVGNHSLRDPLQFVGARRAPARGVARPFVLRCLSAKIQSSRGFARITRITRDLISKSSFEGARLQPCRERH